MFIYTVFNILVYIILCIALAYLLFRIFCHIQGDEKILILTKRRTPFQLEDITFNQATLVTDIPFKNTGKQNGTIMDCYPRHLLPQEQCDSVHVETWLTDISGGQAERHDGYYKAAIIEAGKGGLLRLRVILTGKNGNVRIDGKDFPDMNIDIVYQVVGRSDWHIAKARIELTAEEVRHALMNH